VSASHTTQQSFLLEIEALVAALMGDAQPAEITSLVDQLEVTVDHGEEIPLAAITDVRSAIELVRDGRPCAAVSALLAARSTLGAPPR
jgi:hypothetical protein